MFVFSTNCPNFGLRKKLSLNCGYLFESCLFQPLSLKDFPDKQSLSTEIITVTMTSIDADLKNCFYV